MINKEIGFICIASNNLISLKNPLFKEYWWKIEESSEKVRELLEVEGVEFWKQYSTLDKIIQYMDFCRKHSPWEELDEDDEELFDLLNLIQDEQEEGMISALIDYRLGDFLSSRQYDIWWSVKKADIDESFLQIKNIMMKVLLPELKKLEDEEFAKKFIRNIELSYELG